MFGFFASIVGAIRDIFIRRQEIAKANHELKKAVIENKKELATSKVLCNSSWELGQLLNTDTFLRRLVFVIIVLPYIVAIFAPEHVNTYFQHSLQSIPEWWRNTFIYLVAAIYGFQKIADGIGNIITAVRSYIAKK